MPDPVDIDGHSAEAAPEAFAEANARLRGRVAAELDRWLIEPLGPALYVVATPIGNLGDITLRALAVLARVDFICCEDTRHSRTLLDHFGIDRPLRAYHEHNADAERPRVLAMLAQGRTVALISDAGTPLVSDPGFKLVRACVEAEHRVVALPGPSAAMTALVSAGLPTDQFHFAGFLPQRAGQRRTRLGELAILPATVILFEAPGRLAATLLDIAQVLGRDRSVVVARELTKRFEEIRRGPAEDVAAWAAAEPPRGEVVILLGPSARREATDAEIEDALAPLIASLGVKEAAKTAAARLGVPRSRAYAIALSLKVRTP